MKLWLPVSLPDLDSRKKVYSRCILVLRLWNVEILRHFNLAFSQCSTSIYQALDRQTEFSQVFTFVILSYFIVIKILFQIA